MIAAKGSAKVDATAAVVNDVIEHHKQMMQKMMSMQEHILRSPPPQKSLDGRQLTLSRNKYPRGAQYSVLDASFTRTTANRGTSDRQSVRQVGPAVHCR